MIQISIIIPIYNGGKYLQKILNSILRLNESIMENLEVLLINDGSTDDTDTICKELAKKYNKVKYHKKENGGIASARNYGLENVIGEYVTFCDQDDNVIEGYSEFLSLLSEHQSDFLISDFYLFKSLKSIKKNQVYDGTYVGDDIKKIAARLLGGNVLISDKNIQCVSPSIWNCIFRRSFIENNKLRFQQIMSYEDDWHFMLDSLLAANNVIISSSGYYEWFVNDSSESHTHHYRTNFTAKREKLLETIDSFLSHLEFVDCRKKCRFKKLLLKRSLLWGHWNAKLREESLYLHEIDKIVQSFPPKLSMIKYSKSFDEPITILLLWLRMYRIAYFFNKKVCKRYYQ